MGASSPKYWPGRTHARSSSPPVGQLPDDLDLPALHDVDQLTGITLMKQHVSGREGDRFRWA
ncbi:MAG TPA: hypothetical protein VF972_12400, partial [Actinomycetota bacterium]